MEPHHYLAYWTDIKYRGERLNEQQKEEARIWLHEKQHKCLEHLIQFEAESPPFPISFFRVSQIKSSVWWKGLLRISGFHQGFIQLMIHLHSCPCSSSSIERIFSNFGLIHSKFRNRLGVQRAAKLVMCYRMLRGSYDLEGDDVN